jgi:hypothetical protein
MDATLPICAALALVACAVSSHAAAAQPARPADLRVEYQWRAGSMPPPYHYEYSIVIEPGGTGRMEMVPNYPSDSTPRWTEAFALTPAQLEGLYATLRANRLFSGTPHVMEQPPVGGSTDHLTVVAGGKTYTLPSHVVPAQRPAAEACTAAVKALVPKTIWDALHKKRQDYEDAYKR